MSTVYIRCEVLPGIFDTEYIVLVNGSSAYYISRENVKVPSEPAEKGAVEGTVRGYLINEEGDKALVQLPGEAVVGGLRTWVEQKDVIRAA